VLLDYDMIVVNLNDMFGMHNMLFIGLFLLQMMSVVHFNLVMNVKM